MVTTSNRADQPSASGRFRVVSTTHDWPRTVLVVLELALAVGATAGTVGMLGNGDALFDGRVTSLDLPFHSWTIAGMTLLVLVAVVPFAVAIAAWRDQRWARAFGHLFVAVTLAGWIVVEVVVLGWISWLQPAFLVYAAVIGALGVVERSARPL